MAIYHFSGTPISRSKGQSSVASSAYRSASRLYDERLDKVFDYTKKQGVVYQEVLLPDNAPAWMADREKLWNNVEAVEKRKDSQLAREFNISLPKELTREQNIALAREYINEHFVSQGMIADFAVHEDKSKDGELQPHAHVMLSMREVSQDGFGQKAREWNDKNNIYVWREGWAESANKHLAMHGHDIRIDHRSLKEQGIDLEPQYKIGAAQSKGELARAEDHVRIARENGEKLLEKPEIALHAITQQQSTFTHHDLARFVNRHSVDAAQFQAVYDKVKASPELVSLGQDEQGKERYTTREMQSIETEMFKAVADLSDKANHRVDSSLVDKVIASRTLTSEQEVALKHITQGKDIACIVGFAGTGKSHMLGAAREVWEASGYRVIGVTLSGIAAENLEASAGIGSRTLASLSYAWDRGRDKLTSNDILVIDEAGMLGTAQKARIMKEVAASGAKAIPVGDPEQLQAIQAGAAFRGIAERTGYIELTDIRRQRIDWQKEATKELATKQTDKAFTRYSEQGFVHALPTQDLARAAMVSQWNEDRLAHGGTSMMLAYTRDDVGALNGLARIERKSRHELGQDVTVQTERGSREFATGDRLYFLKNEKSLGVKNGTLGTIETVSKSHMMVRLDSEPGSAQKQVAVDLNLYNQVEHGYAATIHKSQGVTVDRAYLLASVYMDSHASYVGASRHRDKLDIFYSKDVFANEQKLIASLSRERDKDLIIDYKGDKEALQKNMDVMGRADTTRDTINFAQNKSLTMSEKIKSQRASQDVNLGASIRDMEQKLSLGERLKAYKKDFEAKNPDTARALQTSLMPTHERHATDALKEWQLFEKNLQEARMPEKTKERMQSYAASLEKQPAVLQYVKQHHPDVGKRIEQFAKAHHEKVKEHDRGIDL